MPLAERDRKLRILWKLSLVVRSRGSNVTRACCEPFRTFCATLAATQLGTEPESAIIAIMEAVRGASYAVMTSFLDAATAGAAVRAIKQLQCESN